MWNPSGFSSDSAGKESTCIAGASGDSCLIPGLGRSFGGGNDSLFQCSCLKSSTDRGAWGVTVQRIAKNQTWLSTYAGRLRGREVGYGVVIVQSLSQVRLCDHMNCSKPGFSVLHCLLQFAQTHVHWAGDVIQSIHPLSSPLLLPSIFPSIRVFPNELALTSHSQSIRTSASVLPLTIQGWFLLGLTGLISLLSKGLSRVFFGTTI